MSSSHRLPWTCCPLLTPNRIQENADSRLKVVHLVLYSFWSVRHWHASQQANCARRDACNIILFHISTKNAMITDFTSTPDQLLDIIRKDDHVEGDANFMVSLQASQAIIIDNWSTERFVSLSLKRFHPFTHTLMILEHLL